MIPICCIHRSLPTSGSADCLSVMPTIFQKECLKNPSMTHRVIEHSRTLHYVFAKHSLLVLLFLSWFSWKWSRKPSFWETHIPTFHVGRRVMECLTRVGSLGQRDHEELDSDRHARKYEHFQESFCETSWATQFFLDYTSWEVVILVAKPLAPQPPSVWWWCFDLSFQDGYVTALTNKVW